MNDPSSARLPDDTGATPRRFGALPPLLLLTLSLGIGSAVAQLTPLEPHTLAKMREQAQGRANAASMHLKSLRPALGLDNDHQFGLRRSQTDHFGQTHSHFHQHYKGIRVWGAKPSPIAIRPAHRCG